MCRRRGALAIVVCFVLGAPQAQAWDDKGHRIVAFIAEHYMRPAALEQAVKILSADQDNLAEHDLGGASTWADHYLRSGDATIAMRYDVLKSWHFADLRLTRPNIPSACYGQAALSQGVAAALGPRDCIIDKIAQFKQELSDPATLPAERLLALKYLLNLVADLHEPLRVMDAHDDHGQLVLVTAPATPSGTLFSLWETTLIAKLGTDAPDIAARIIARTPGLDAVRWSSGTPQLWALEAHALAVDRVYGALGQPSAEGRFPLTDDGLELGLDTVALQLGRAGVRLAYILNEALAPVPVKEVRVLAPRGNAATGRAFALATCSVCHVVASDQLAPKDLAMAPDFESIAATSGVDEDGLREFLFGPHPTMPSLVLDGARANDVIAYILSFKRQRR